jgi:hypothetical protein
MGKLALTLGKPGARTIRASLKRARASVNVNVARARTMRAQLDRAARQLAQNAAIEAAWQSLGRALVVCALLGVAFVLFALLCIAAGAYRGIARPAPVLPPPAPTLTLGVGPLPRLGTKDGARRPPSHFNRPLSL